MKGIIMDKCELFKPDFSFESYIQLFRKEMLVANSSIDGTGPLKRMENIKEWLEFNQRCENKETVPENWVTCIQGNEGSKRTILANDGIYEV